jgi:hypothetical protein
VVRFAGRAGIVRYAHCSACDTTTRQVLERTAVDRYGHIPAEAGCLQPVAAGFRQPVVA